MTVANYIKKLL